MQIIPLSSVPSQKLSILLGGQNCQIAVSQKGTGLYLDLSVNNIPIVTGVLCLDRDPIAKPAFLGFSGYLKFADIRGTTDPHYSELGSRYKLVYVT